MLKKITPKRKAWMILGLALLGLIASVSAVLFYNAHPARRAVQALLDPAIYAFEADMLLQLTGTNPAPNVQSDPLPVFREVVAKHGLRTFTYLNQAAAQKEPALLEFYRSMHSRLPPWLWKHLPPPTPQDQMSVRALELIARAGPIAARSCQEGVLKGLDHQNPIAAESAIHSFWHLLPDSELAQEAFLKQISKGSNLTYAFPNGIDVLEWKWGQDFPLRLQITNLLHFPRLARHGVAALQAMGEDAEPLIPHLIKILEQGSLSQTSAPAHEREVVSSMSGAARILAYFAPEHPEVVQVLLEGLQHQLPMIRIQCAFILSDLQIEPSVLLPHLMASLEDSDLNAWKAKMRAIGMTTTHAHHLLPELILFTQEGYIKSWYDQLSPKPPTSLSRTHLLNMKLATCVAIGRIAPSEMLQHLSFIVEAIGMHQDPAEFLAEATSLSDRIIPLLEPYLESPSSKKQLIAATILLKHDPNHEKAKEPFDQQSIPLPQPNKVVFGNLLPPNPRDPFPLKQDASINTDSRPLPLLFPYQEGAALDEAERAEVIDQLKEALHSSDGPLVKQAFDTLRAFHVRPDSIEPEIRHMLLHLDVRWEHSHAWILFLKHGVEYLPPLTP